MALISIGLPPLGGVIARTQTGVLSALKKLNENSVNLSKEEIKLLMEIKNLLLKKGIDENPSLDRPVSDFIQPRVGGRGLVFLTDEDFNR